MKLLLRSLVILLAGIGVATAFVPLGSTSWAENTRARRGGRARPPATNLQRPAPRPDPAGAAAPPAPGSPADRGGRAGEVAPPQGRRGGRGRTPGLFTHFRGEQPFAGDALRLVQIAGIQIAIPAGLTLAVLAAARRKRRSSG